MLDQVLWKEPMFSTISDQQGQSHKFHQCKELALSLTSTLFCERCNKSHILISQKNKIK